ncbi:carboxymuconolactone decarboxylase family protein [Litoreibacter roseus]|uniref:4-carboxymuconolactone decarboxylase n=1 Tax=Litoreibacter roseus TaxID=2601869 RepID=A0A6N6JJP6_9RHOB|nr:carboxymuconolactone decarboxylase family protein [Litoreibacter roseus]GFE66553.1 4-carboxymuconolactone decarboxylase [Litoreibacter roseus]
MHKITLSVIAFAISLSMSPVNAQNDEGSTMPDTTAERLQLGADVILKLNNGVPQTTLENMREEFPFLADATQAYALGDVWTRPGLDDRTRQLAAVAAFAVMGERGLMKIHAGYALNVGVTEDELKEIVYMITVPAGFPKAILASQTMSELFEERRSAGTNQ